MDSEEENEQIEYKSYRSWMLYHLYCKFMTTPFVTFIRSMDAQITNNFRQAEIYTR